MTQHRVEVKRSKLRRIIPALMGALAMIVGGVVAVGVSAASAHNAPVNGIAVCEDDGTWTITGSATLQNVPSDDNGKTSVTITASSGSVSQTPDSSATPRPANGAKYSFTVSGIDSSVRSVTVTTTAKWPKNNTYTEQTKINRPQGGCTPQTPPDTSEECTFVWQLADGASDQSPFKPGPQKLVAYDCDSGNPPSYTKECGTWYQIDSYRATDQRLKDMLQNLKTSGVLNNSGEDADLGNEWKKKHNTQYWYFEKGGDCDTEVTPAAVTFDEQCGVDNDTYTIPATDGVEYLVEGSVKPAGTYQASGTVTVTAQATTGHVLASGTWSWTRDFTNEACPTQLTPVAPVLEDAQCMPGTVGQTVYGTVTTVDKDGITYSVAYSGATATVTATVAGADFFGDNGDIVSDGTNNWTVGADGKTATATVTLKTLDCGQPVPVAPTLEDALCTPADAGTTVFGTVTTVDKDGISYSTAYSGATATVTATVAGADFFGDNGDVVSDGTNDWTVGVDGKTATATVTLKAKDCGQPVPVAPTLEDALCTPADAGTTVFGTVTTVDKDGISYSTAYSGATATVTATATGADFFGDNGDVVSDGTNNWTVGPTGQTATITVTLKAKDCLTTLLATPHVDTAQCSPDDAGSTVWDTVTAPVDTADIAYTVSAPDADNKVAVTATAKGDVYLTQSGTEWTIDGAKKSATQHIQLTSAVCATTELATPQVDTAQCSVGDSGTVWGSATAPADTAEIDYEQSEDPSTHIVTITASIKAGHADLYLTQPDTEWTISADKTTATLDIQLTSTTCSTPTTTPPGTPQRLLAQPAVDNQCLLVGDAHAVTATTTTVRGIDYTVTGNGSTTVTVTATARTGFALTIPAGWTDNHDGTATIVLTPNSDGVVCVGGESSTVSTPPSATAAVLLPSNTAGVEVLPASATVSAEIAYTGVDTLKFAALALLLLLGGSGLLAFATMRRAPRAH